MDGWIGVDLDGTLAKFQGWQGAEYIGEPIPCMVNRVKRWLAEGKDVRILTARVSGNHLEAELSRIAIHKWCMKYFKQILPVTATKDYGMVECWDDRAVQVVPNTGQPLRELLEKAETT